MVCPSLFSLQNPHSLHSLLLPRNPRFAIFLSLNLLSIVNNMEDYLQYMKALRFQMNGAFWFRPSNNPFLLSSFLFSKWTLWIIVRRCWRSSCQDFCRRRNSLNQCPYTGKRHPIRSHSFSFFVFFSCNLNSNSLILLNISIYQ